jgi:hypothetical protein
LVLLYRQPLILGVAATSEDFRSVIRELFWSASDKGLTFAEVLKVTARAASAGAIKGKVLVGTTASGVSASFQLPPSGDLTQGDFSRLLSAILDEHEYFIGLYPEIGDAELKTKLLSMHDREVSVRSDFSGMRL